jgi:hypothetical protein
MQKTYDNYREIGSPPENPWNYPTVIAVGPKGQIVQRHITPGRTGEIGDVPIRTIDGMPVLSPRYAQQGWVLYEDLCMGKVPGIAADHDAWERWERLVELYRRGQTMPAGAIDDDTFFHPEVARRRADGGTRRMLTREELQEMFPGVTINEKDDDGT